ncbi:MAG: aspartate aminotransferase family protein [Vulcanisaeta sp.]|jgi:glutamate-1-semialdehyde 2,1-aminomutase|nr:aspartate aminotransferase family protein [Vulcanisaeta sp.]
MDILDLIENVKKEYVNKTRRSQELYDELKKYTPYGVHSNWRIWDPYPMFMSRARGSRIWDVDGNEYVDFCMAFGALVVGHSHPVLINEVSSFIANGTIYGFETEYSVKLAKVLLDRFGMDMVRFSNTGGEATELAVRLARAYTGRKYILKFEGHYHGSRDTLMVGLKPIPARAGHPKEPRSVPASMGLPEDIYKTVLVAQWNDEESVEKVFSKYGDEIAGIILEPIAMNMGFIPPKKGFLDFLRKISDEYGSVLIFDEVKTSGKFYGGAEEYFGVKPDIKIVSKAIGGGFPFSAVLGKKDIMELIGPNKVAHGGTFNSNPLSVYAAYITLTKILTRDAMTRASNLSEEIAKAGIDIMNDNKIPAYISYAGTSGGIYLTREAVELRNWRDFVKYVNLDAMYVYLTSMVSRGLIPQCIAPDEQWTVSVQHTKEDVDRVVEGMKHVVSLLKSSGVGEVFKIEEAF